ncbi:MAG: hypothetical protein ACI9IP_000856 [Arcticibacterium sp.]|jgi:hypothetical protein
MMPLEKMKYGLAEFDTAEKQTFLYLIKSPFINIKRAVSGQKEATKTKKVSKNSP